MQSRNAVFPVPNSISQQTTKRSGHTSNALENHIFYFAQQRGHSAQNRQQGLQYQQQQKQQHSSDTNNNSSINLLQSSFIRSSKDNFNFPDSRGFQSHRSSKEKLFSGNTLPIKQYKFQSQPQQQQYAQQIMNPREISREEIFSTPRQSKILQGQQIELTKDTTCAIVESFYLSNRMPNNNNAPKIFYKRMRNCKAVKHANSSQKPQGDKSFRENLLNLSQEGQIPQTYNGHESSCSPERLKKESIYNQKRNHHNQTNSEEIIIITNEKQINHAGSQKDNKECQHELQKEEKINYDKFLLSTDMQSNRIHQISSSAISTTDKSSRAKSANSNAHNTSIINRSKNNQNEAEQFEKYLSTQKCIHNFAFPNSSSIIQYAHQQFLLVQPHQNLISLTQQLQLQQHQQHQQQQQQQSLLHSQSPKQQPQQQNQPFLLPAQKQQQEQQQQQHYYYEQKLLGQSSVLEQNQQLQQHYQSQNLIEEPYYINQISQTQHLIKQKKNSILKRIQNTKKLQQLRYSPNKQIVFSHSENKNDSEKQEYKIKPTSAFSQGQKEINHSFEVEELLSNPEMENCKGLQINPMTYTRQSSSADEISPLNVLNNHKRNNPNQSTNFFEINMPVKGELISSNEENIFIHLEDIKKQQEEQMRLVDQQQQQYVQLENLTPRMILKRSYQEEKQINLTSFIDQKHKKRSSQNSQSVYNPDNLHQLQRSNHYQIQEQNLFKSSNSFDQIMEQKNLNLASQDQVNNELNHYKVSLTAPLRNKQSKQTKQTQMMNESLNQSNYYQFIEECQLNTSQGAAANTLSQSHQKLQNHNEGDKQEDDENISQKEITINSNLYGYSHNLARKYDSFTISKDKSKNILNSLNKQTNPMLISNNLLNQHSLSNQSKINTNITNNNSAKNNNGFERLPDAKRIIPSSANSPTRREKQDIPTNELQHQLQVEGNIGKESSRNHRVIHSSCDKSRNEHSFQQKKMMISAEVEKKLKAISHQITKANPFLLAKSKELVSGVKEVKQKEFDMDNIFQGKYSSISSEQTRKKEGMYSAGLRTDRNTLEKRNQEREEKEGFQELSFTERRRRKDHFSNGEQSKNSVIIVRKKSKEMREKCGSTNSSSSFPSSMNQIFYFQSESQKFVWHRMGEQRPVEMNLQIWDMITRFLSIADLSMTRGVCKSWNKYAQTTILERHQNQLDIDTRKSEEIKQKYDIQNIYSVLNLKTQDIFDVFSPLCCLSVQQLQQPLFLNFQPPCLQITLECFRLFLSNNKNYFCPTLLYSPKRTQTTAILEYPLPNNLPKRGTAYDGSKSRNNSNNSQVNRTQLLSQQHNSSHLDAQINIKNRTMSTLALYEEYQRIQMQRKRYYCKLFLGDNVNKKSLFHDAINQQKDLLWFMCTFDHSQLERIKNILRNNQKSVWNQNIIKQYGEVVSKITALLLGIVALYNKFEKHYPQLIQYVDSIRYYYSLHYSIGDKITKQNADQSSH